MLNGREQHNSFLVYKSHLVCWLTQFLHIQAVKENSDTSCFALDSAATWWMHLSLPLQFSPNKSRYIVLSLISSCVEVCCAVIPVPLLLVYWFFFFFYLSPTQESLRCFCMRRRHHVMQLKLVWPHWTNCLVIGFSLIGWFLKSASS